jgi:hypothetical protein
MRAKQHVGPEPGDLVDDTSRQHYMTGRKVREAYERALHAYEAAKACNGDRVTAFAQFLSAEMALASSQGSCRGDLSIMMPVESFD